MWKPVRKAVLQKLQKYWCKKMPMNEVICGVSHEAVKSYLWILGTENHLR
jgi:hypothetical protein